MRAARRSPCRPSLRAVAACVVGILLAVILAGCGASQWRTPVLDALAARLERPVVVFVPGITGTVLRDSAKGKVAWGKGSNLYFPRDLSYSLALPLGEGAAPSPLVPGGVLETITLAGVVRKPIYGPLLKLLVAHGYRRGDLDSPRPGETFFPFSYDWRRSNLEVAARLAASLERLRQVRGEETLRVNLVCQSNGGQICRYLTKYGGRPLEEVEAGATGPPPGVAIDKVVFAGTGNGGSLRVLAFMNRGRRYAPLGRWSSPEVLFTFPSLFQDLPVVPADLFLDTRGEIFPVDLHNPASWKRYGWSVYGKEARERLDRSGREDLFGSPPERDAHLERSLEVARRFHDLLQRDVPGFASRYFFIQGRGTPTPARAVLVEVGVEVEGGDGWKTLLPDDRFLEKLVKQRPELLERTRGPGDEHATVESQGWLSAQERDALAEPIWARGGHFELILSPEAKRGLLEILAAP